MPKLNKEQIEEIKKELVSMEEAETVRFLYHGQNLNIITGDLQPKGLNILYQIVYWHFKKETIEKILKYLGNDVKVIYSK